MNETISMLKLTLIAAVSVVLAYFNALLIPIVVLVAVMVIDYISGMTSAKRTGEIWRLSPLEWSSIISFHQRLSTSAFTFR